MNEPQSFVLSPAERGSPLWLKLKAYLDQRLQNARERNDGPLDADQTARTRGEIDALKALLRLGRELPPFDDGDGSSPRQRALQRSTDG